MTVVYFGPLTCSIVTTTRKFFTILGSVIFFGNVMSTMQWVGTILVFLGENLPLFKLTCCLYSGIQMFSLLTEHKKNMAEAFK